MSGFATIGGKVVPMGGTSGPKIHTGPRQGQFWHHPDSGKKTYGPVPLKHQKAVEAAGGPKATGQAPKKASSPNAKTPTAHAAPSHGREEAVLTGAALGKGMAVAILGIIFTGILRTLRQWPLVLQVLLAQSYTRLWV